jgi:hypothetical protein
MLELFSQEQHQQEEKLQEQDTAAFSEETASLREAVSSDVFMNFSPGRKSYCVQWSDL